MSTERRRRLSVAAAVAVAVGAMLAVAGTSGSSQSRRKPLDPQVATVRRLSLSAHVNAHGVLQYAGHPDGSPFVVVNHAGGVLTELPSPGQVVRQGDVLFRVAGRPVVLLDGSTPAYRTLSEGAKGPDVRELNADLVILGYAARSELSPSSDYYGAQTVYALRRLEAQLGVARTGSLKLGDAVFLPTPLRITRVLATLGTGAAGAPSVGPGGTRNTSATPRPHSEFVSLTSTTPTVTAATPRPAPNPSTRGPKRCRRRGHQKPAKNRLGPPQKCAPSRPKRGRRGPHPAHQPPKPRAPGGGSRSAVSGGRSARPAASSQGSAGRGRGGGKPAGAANGGGVGRGNAPPAQPILEATSTSREVLVNLDAAEVAHVRVGERAAITLPDGRITPGVVTRIGTVATSSGGGSGSASTVTVPIYIALDHPQAAGAIDQAPVQVQITTATVRRTLAVPVTALVALPRGRFGLEIVARRARRVVPVAVGLIDDANGLVQVTSPSLTSGQRVLVPSGVI